MKTNVPIYDLACDLCRSDTQQPYESHAPYTLVSIRLPEDNKEVITVSVDVKKISWQEKSKGKYLASAIMSVVCPYCQTPHDLRHQLEAPRILLKNVGVCKTCGGDLSLEDETIEYIDYGEAGSTIFINGELLCLECTKREETSFEISSASLSPLIQSKTIDIEFTDSGIRINDQNFIKQTKRKRLMKVTSILFLAADPSDASRLRLGEEFREIQEKLKLAKLRERFTLELPQLSVRPTDISQALLDTNPQIVHFSGHGISTGALCFEDNKGQIHFVQPDALASLFERFAHRIKCILLNACYSEIQARAIAQHIEYVIGMNNAIGENAAIAFAVGFYQALGGGRAIEEAYKLGRVQIMLQSIPEHLTPVLFKKGQVQS